ncbi:MAG: hypothetical protein WCA10_08780 [Terracidiphilus sp.]
MGVSLPENWRDCQPDNLHADVKLLATSFHANRLILKTQFFSEILPVINHPRRIMNSRSNVIRMQAMWNARVDPGMRDKIGSQGRKVTPKSFAKNTLHVKFN